MINIQRVTRLLIRNVGSFHLAYFAKSTFYIHWTLTRKDSCKHLFEELRRSGFQGFQTWLSKICELSNSCGLDLDRIACVDKKESLLVPGIIEDEANFVTNCSMNLAGRRLLYSKISCKVPCFSTASDFDNCLYLLANNDPQALAWFQNFVHQSFITPITFQWP